MNTRTTRRRVLATAAASMTAGWRPTGASTGGRYTAANAPDDLTRSVLSVRLDTLDQGVPIGGDPTPYINANFGRVIEQNFARRNGWQSAALWSALNLRERAGLAQGYMNSTSGQGRLLDLLAVRLDGKELGSVAEHFGFAPVYAALWRRAPSKSVVFERNADPNWAAPIVGLQELPAHTSSGVPLPTAGSFRPTTDMTLHQIYTGFRTADLGSLSVRSALYETAMYAMPRFGGAWYVGYGLIGPQISNFIQTYAPDLHSALGEGLYNIHRALINVFSSPAPNGGTADSIQRLMMGGIQISAWESFGMPEPLQTPLQAVDRGGDYQSLQPFGFNWYTHTRPPVGGGGGGSSCPRDGCPIQQ